MEALQAVARAPEFDLHSTPDQRVKLSGFRGQRVILAFCPTRSAGSGPPPAQLDGE